MIGAASLLWRSDLRQSRRRALGIAVLLAVGGGVALGVIAGARRTADAFDRVVTLTTSGELGASYADAEPDRVRAQLEGLPAVGSIGQRVGFQVAIPGTPIAGLASFARYEDPVVVDRPLLLDGRAPRSADELMFNEIVQRRSGLSVGDEVEIELADAERTVMERETMHVVGVFAGDLYEDETSASPALVYAKSFVEPHRDLISWGGVLVTLAPGATRAEAVEQLLGRGLVLDDDRDLDREQAWGAIRPLVSTTMAFGALAGIATVVLVGQALRRLVRRSPSEERALAACGCDRRTLFLAESGVAAAVVIAGVVGAVGVAIAVSPLFPLGRAHRIPALRGLDVDGFVLAIGALVLLVALMVSMALVSRRRSTSTSPRTGWAPGLLSQRPTTNAAMRFVTGQAGLGGTVAGVALGLTFLVAGVVFTESVHNLVARPELSGFTWDLVAREPYAMIDTAAVSDRLASQPAVQRVTGLTFVDVTVDGRPYPASVWEPVKGSPWPTLSAGRAPITDDEVLVGEATLRELGYQIGDTITVGFAASLEAVAQTIDRPMTVVGTAVSPAIGLAGTDTPRLDDGFLVQREDLPRAGIEYGSAVLFDLAPDTDPGVIRAQFPDGLPDDLGVSTEWFEGAQPAEVVQSARALGVLRLAIVVLVAAMMATVALNLLTFVRERRHSFAVLQALGFTTRQVRSTVLWQSGVVVGFAVLVSAPLGIAAGRWLYKTFAGDIGVLVAAVAPVAAVALAVCAGAGALQAAALVPAGHARRATTASELQSE